MDKEAKAAILKSLRVGSDIGMASLEKGNIENRTFTLYVGNEYKDASLNTAQGRLDVAVCVEFLKGCCYRHFAEGQMEHVLEECVSVMYIDTPAGVVNTIKALRELGVKEKIAVSVEYVEGCPIHLYFDEIEEVEAKATHSNSFIQEVCEECGLDAQTVGHYDGLLGSYPQRIKNWIAEIYGVDLDKVQYAQKAMDCVRHLRQNSTLPKEVRLQLSAALDCLEFFFGLQ